MRHIIITILTVLLFGTALTQTQLNYTSTDKEYSFKLFPYSDGSFSIYSTSYEKLDPAATGTLRTYDEMGELILEKAFPDVMQFANHRAKEGYEMLLLFHQFSNMVTKEAVTIGYSGKLNFHCRIMNEKGEVKDIVVEKSAMKSEGNLIVQGYGIDSQNNVNVVLATSKLKGKNQVVLLHFDIKQNSFKVIELNNQDPDNSFSYLRFVGSRNSQLVFLCEDKENDNRVDLLEINSNGEIKKRDLQLPPEIGNIASSFVENVPVIGGFGEHLVFYIRKIRTTEFTICKLSQDNQAKWTSWTVPKDLLDRETATYKSLEEQSAFVDHFPSLSIYDLNGDTRFVYSYKGKDLAIFSIDMEQLQIATFSTDNYFDRINPGSITDLNITNKIISSSPLNFVSIVLDQDDFQKVKKQLILCNEKNSQCLMELGTVFKADGTYGFLAITGDKVEGKQYYQNVKIVKY
jgi:hypothetical protein